MISPWHKEAGRPYATMDCLPDSLYQVGYDFPWATQLLRLLRTVLSALMITSITGVENPFLFTSWSHSESPTATLILETGGHLKAARRQKAWWQNASWWLIWTSTGTFLRCQSSFCIVGFLSQFVETLPVYWMEVGILNVQKPHTSWPERGSLCVCILS